MLEVVFALVYYIALLFGAVTFGYVVLSFSIPSFSQFEKEERLGYSTISGIALVLLALIIDSIAFGFENVLQVKGFFPIWLFLLAAAAILCSNAYSLVLKKPIVVRQSKAVDEGKVEEIKKQIELIAQREQENQKPKPSSVTGGAPPWIVREELVKKQEQEKLRPPLKLEGGKAIIDSIAQNASEQKIERPIIESDAKPKQIEEPVKPAVANKREKQIKLMEQQELEKESDSK